MKKSLPYIMPVFRSALFIAGGFLFAAITNQSLEESAQWWTILCTVYNIITILVLVSVCYFEGSKYRDLINYKKEQLSFKSIFGVTILMLLTGVGGMFVVGFTMYGYIPTLLAQPIPIWIAILNAILFPITIVFAELPLYYGYSFNRIKKDTGNTLLAMSYIVFFYALQHSFIPLLFDWEYVFFRFLSFLPLMIVLGIIYNKKRALTPLMIGHGILDFALGMQILISSVFPSIFEIMQQSAGR